MGIFGMSYSGDIEGARRLLQQEGGGVLNEICGDKTALTIAAGFGHTELVSLYLENGADSNLADGYGRPLVYAVSKGHTAIVALLLQNGASIADSVTSRGSTSLHLACERKDNIEAITLLIDNGAKVHAANKLGITPFHNACGIKGNIEVIKLLIDKGAGVNCKDTDAGTTPPPPFIML